MKKTIFSLILFSSLFYGADISYLPSSKYLNTGDDIKDTALSQKGTGDATQFHSNAFSISGAGQYTLNSNDNTTTFYATSFNVGQSTKFALVGFHTMAFNGGLTLGANSTFAIISSGNEISAAGSDFGGESKVKFYKRESTINLGANSSATFSNAPFFISYAKMILAQGSSLNINANKAIRLGNEFTNNGGVATLKGNVYNVGSTVGVFNKTTISNFIVNSGEVSVDGNFYNGIDWLDIVVDETAGSNPLSNTIDPPYGGGGNIIINGGTLSITGDLISQLGGHSISGGGVSDPQNSSISLYGGTLKVGGTLQNKEGSSINFGVGNNGQMGKLEGTLSNDKGVVAVDIKNAQLNKEYTIITGAITGLNEIDIIGSSQFLDINYKDDVGNISGKITIKEKTNANGTSSFDNYKETLQDNEKGILNAIENKMNGTILTSGINIDETLATTDEAIKESYVAQPTKMMNALQSSVILIPTQKSTNISARTAATEIIRFDNGKRITPFYQKIVPKRNFYVSPLWAILRAEKLEGHIAGFTLGTQYQLEEFSSNVHFSYAYGSSSQDINTQNTKTKADMFQMGFTSNYSYSVLELATNANLALGFFKINNQWQNMPEFASKADFSNYQFNLGLLGGVKLEGEKLSFKPFVGVQNYFEFQEGFKQSGGLGLESKAYNAYIIDGVLGLKTSYVYNEFASFFVQFNFENRLYNTHKEVFMRILDDELKYENQSYDNILGVHLGTQIFTYYHFNLDAELLYKHYNSGLNYFGGSLLFKYHF